MPELIRISKKEYEGMKETIVILQDSKLIKDIERDLKELRKAERDDKLVKLKF